MKLSEEFLKGIWKENPVLVLILGMCPSLATSSNAVNGMGMGLATTFVLLCSNVVISAVRNIVPAKIRIPCYIVVIATFVTVVDLLMQAYTQSLYNALGIFIPLIVVNCIVDEHIKRLHQLPSLPSRGLLYGIDAVGHILCLGESVLIAGENVTLGFLCISIAACGFEEHFKYRTFFGCFNLGFPVIRMLDDCDISFDDLFIHSV